MTVLRDRISYTKGKGQPVRFGSTELTPLSQTMSVRLPFWSFIWNRPVGYVFDDGQSSEEVAIVDVTLLIQLGMLAVTIAAFILTIIAGRIGQK